MSFRRSAVWQRRGGAYFDTGTRASRGRAAARLGTVRQLSRSSAAGRYGLAFALLIAVSDLNFRSRDPTEALSGAIDAQVLVELGTWAFICLWAGTRAVRRRLDGALAADVRLDAGPALRVLAVIATAYTVSVFYAQAEMFAAVRSLQYSLQVVLVLWLSRELRHRTHGDAIASFWRSFRRGVWLLIALATAATLLYPGWENRSEGRFNFLEMHPIATAALLGVAAIFLLGSYLAMDDRWFSGPLGSLARSGLLTGVCVMLVATRSRGAIAATVAGMATLIALTPWKRRGQLAVLVVGVAVSAFLAGFGGDFVREVVVRDSENSIQTLSGRTEVFDRAADLFIERPVSGYGYLAGRSVFREDITWAGDSHNAYVEVVVGLGMLGAVLYAFLFLSIGRGLVRAIRGASIELSCCAREAAAMCVFVLVAGVASQGFAGSVGHETLLLAAAVLVADLGRRSLPSLVQSSVSSEAVASHVAVDQELVSTVTTRGAQLR